MSKSRKKISELNSSSSSDDSDHDQDSDFNTTEIDEWLKTSKLESLIPKFKGIFTINKM